MKDAQLIADLRKDSDPHESVYALIARWKAERHAAADRIEALTATLRRISDDD